MYGHHQYHYPYHHAHHHGLIGIVGGIIGLTTTSLQAGARVVRTIVEGSLWDECDYPYSMHHHPGYHCYHVECHPREYHCSCRDC